MATMFEPVSGSRAGPGARSAGGARWDQPGWKGWLQGNSQTEEDSYSIIFLWGELRLVSVKELFFLQSGCLFGGGARGGHPVVLRISGLLLTSRPILHPNNQPHPNIIHRQTLGAV